ncbi:EamA family transporter [Micromonospora radicis]|uniref:EamA family transporter n=1 Tax=Micromonospora radicis TaxID=1894971 RepID=A0A418MU14_9ACTN|nr:EamA family transporter [Micromonospora radicis]RIV37632.1 EamA family transporter [Micromonospora radicis]
MDGADPRGTALVTPTAPPGGTTPTTPLALATGLVLLYLVWGSTYLGNRIALETLPPLASTSARFLAAGAVLFAVVAVRRGAAGLRLPRHEWAAVAVTGTLMVGAGSALLAIGQQHVPSGLTSLLVAGMPVWVLLIRFGTGQRPAPLAVAGVLGGLAGLVLLLVAPTERWHLAGMLTIVASTLVWAAGSMLAQRLAMPADHLVGTGWQMVAGGTGVAIAGLCTGEWAELRLAAVSGRSWLAWTYLMVVCTVLGFSVYTWLLRRAPLQLAATYAYVNPVVAVLLGMAVLDERLTGRQLLAGVVVLSAVALVVARERPRRWAGLPPATPAPP